MPVLSDELRERIRAEFPKYPDKRAVTLPALHIVHDAHARGDDGGDGRDCGAAGAAPAEISDTMTFYQFFKEEGHAMGKHRVWVCRSISCMLRGGEEMLEKLCQKSRASRAHIGGWEVHAGVCGVPGRLRRGSVHAGG